MTKFEKLVAEIIADAEKDGEPVTQEQAEEMAKMELGAKEITTYNQSDKPREKSTRVPKVDDEKVILIQYLFDSICQKENVENSTIANKQKEITFNYGGNAYSINLVKHRPPKV